MRDPKTYFMRILRNIFITNHLKDTGLGKIGQIGKKIGSDDF